MGGRHKNYAKNNERVVVRVDCLLCVGYRYELQHCNLG